MQAKGAIVPFAYGSRQEALIFRRDFMQIQVQTQPEPEPPNPNLYPNRDPNLIQVQTGLLSMASYLQQLREAIPQEVRCGEM